VTRTNTSSTLSAAASQRVAEAEAFLRQVGVRVQYGAHASWGKFGQETVVDVVGDARVEQRVTTLKIVRGRLGALRSDTGITVDGVAYVLHTAQPRGIFDVLFLGGAGG
jgi:hypothetical protein